MSPESLVWSAALLALSLAAQTRGPVVLVPIGDFPPELLDDVARSLHDDLQVDVTVGPELLLPHAAYYAKRKRYRADGLLDALEGNIIAPARAKLLGLTAVDISTTKGDVYDWGVFGLGRLGGRSAVLSIYRFQHHLHSTPEQLRWRLRMTALHEVGHALGLEHCTEPRCFMQDAEGSIHNTDTASGKLGSFCRTRLDALAPLYQGR